MTRYFLLLLVLIYVIDASFSAPRPVATPPATVHATVKTLPADSSAIARLSAHRR